MTFEIKKMILKFFKKNRHWIRAEIIIRKVNEIALHIINDVLELK